MKKGMNRGLLAAPAIAEPVSIRRDERAATRRRADEAERQAADEAARAAAAAWEEYEATLQFESVGAAAAARVPSKRRGLPAGW